MRRCHRGCWVVVFIAGWSSLTAWGAEPTAAAIAQWVQQLGDDSFAVRESAGRQLLQAGGAAIEPIAEAAAVANRLEVIVRGTRILETFASSTDITLARSARAALVKLAASRDVAVALRARNALRVSQQRIVALLQACGARIGMRDGRITVVNFDAAKSLGENLRLLHELPDLEQLSCSTQLMDDDGLAELAGLPRVTDLNLYRSRIGDAGLKHLASLPRLRSVPMGETRVTDAGLVHLKALTQLEYIGLRGNQITDAGLVHLKDLTNLTGLYLGETKVTDAGLLHVRPLSKLNRLILGKTVISDAGLEHLNELTDLRSLDLSETRVTPAGIAILQSALPDVQINTRQP